jgi:hypothetical protein
MRTRTVRIVSYLDRMINPGIAESLAEIHQHRLHQEADRVRAARAARRVRSRRHPLRSRAGWWMVHAGIRLALTDRTSWPTDIDRRLAGIGGVATSSRPC